MITDKHGNPLKSDIELEAPTQHDFVLPSDIVFDQDAYTNVKAVSPIVINQRQIKREMFYWPCVNVQRRGKMVLTKQDVPVDYICPAYVGYAKHANEGYGNDAGDNNYEIIWDAELQSPLASGCITACVYLLHAYKSRHIINEDQHDTVIDARQIIQSNAKMYDVDPSDMMERYRQVRKSFLQIPTFTPPETVTSLLGNMKTLAQDEIIKD